MSKEIHEDWREIVRRRHADQVASLRAEIIKLRSEIERLRNSDSWASPYEKPRAKVMEIMPKWSEGSDL